MTTSNTISRPIEQQPWGRWNSHGGWLYPAGVMTIDVKEANE